MTRRAISARPYLTAMVDVFDAPRRSLLQTTIGSDSLAVGVWDTTFEAYKVEYELTTAAYWDMTLTVTPSGSSVVGTWQTLPSTACNAVWTLVSWITRHSMTWRAISVRPYY